MIGTLVKESKELLKDKENESTWFKVFTLFEKLDRAFKTKEDVVESFTKFTDIVHRSIQSDRSRLNGISLGFLKKCVEMANGSLNFNGFVAPVLRLTGKSNKVFVGRAMETLEALSKHADPKCLLRSINDNIDSANKNVRLASYTIASWRVQDSYVMFWPLIERGLKDPAQEVRSVCKGVVEAKNTLQSTGNEVKKNAIANLTPRKNFKVGKDREEEKKTECEMVKIAKEHLSRKPIQQEFFERLNQLKKDRHTLPEKKEDDLTPRRLDRYLNRFRCNPSGSGIGTVCPRRSLAQSSKNPSPDEAASEATPELAVTNKLADVSSRISREAQVSFVQETLLFKREMNSSGHRDASIVHETVDTYVAHQEISSGGITGQEDGEDALRKYEDLLVQDSLLECPDLSCIEDQTVSDLSRSFAGIAIEPSRCGDDFNKEELRSVEQGLPFNCNDASPRGEAPVNDGEDQLSSCLSHKPIDVSEGSRSEEICAGSKTSINRPEMDDGNASVHSLEEMEPSAIVGLYENGCGTVQASRAQSNSTCEHDSLYARADTKSTKTKIPVGEDLDGVLGSDLDALQYANPDSIGDSVLLNDMIVDADPAEKASAESQGTSAAECRKAEDGHAPTCNTVHDQGVQDVFCPESSKLSAHKLFNGNIFDSNDEDANSDGATNKPVFIAPTRAASDMCPNRFSLDSKQDTLLDNVSQCDQE